MSSKETIKVAKKESSAQGLSEIFNDFESRSNIVGFFDLLLKIDKRIHPENYK